MNAAHLVVVAFECGANVHEPAQSARTRDRRLLALRFVLFVVCMAGYLWDNETAHYYADLSQKRKLGKLDCDTGGIV